MRGGFTSGCWAETRCAPAIDHATTRTRTATNGRRTIDDLFTATSCLALGALIALNFWAASRVPSFWVVEEGVAGQTGSYPGDRQAMTSACVLAVPGAGRTAIQPPPGDGGLWGS